MDESKTQIRWVELATLVEHTPAPNLLEHGVEMLRPIAVDRSGIRNVYREQINDDLESLVRCLLTPIRERHYTFEGETLAAAEYSDIAFETRTLVAWMDKQSIPVPAEWQRYKSDIANADAANDDSAIVVASDTTLTLSHDELVELTGKKRGFAQHKVLQKMRIPTRVRSDGAVVVFRHDIQATTVAKPKPKQRPDYDALG